MDLHLGDRCSDDLVIDHRLIFLRSRDVELHMLKLPSMMTMTKDSKLLSTRRKVSMIQISRRTATPNGRLSFTQILKILTRKMMKTFNLVKTKKLKRVSQKRVSQKLSMSSHWNDTRAHVN